MQRRFTVSAHLLGLTSVTLLCLGTTPLLVSPASAALLTWDGSTGNWDTDASWLGGPEPTSSDDAFINAGLVDVTLPGEQAFIISLNAGLNVSGGGTLTNSHSIIGDQAAVTGVATVSGPGSTWNAGSLALGNFGGHGTLDVQSGGALVSTGITSVGLDAASTGAVTVNGAGSTWDNSSALRIGDNGAGTLNIQAGGVVNISDYGNIAFNSGSSGAVTVTGSGSTWNATVVRVGKAGDGTLDIQDGATVTSFGVITSIIGSDAGSTGVATVTGPGSNWVNNDSLVVGEFGTGTLDIENGGAVTNATGTIGLFNTGLATVTGAGSTWTNTGNLTLGLLDSGTLNVLDGGSVSNVDGLIGSVAGSTGVATVNGAGSTWTNTGTLVVGDAGSGTLNVQDGGTVTNTVGTIGVDNTTGVATVTGTGSTWTNSGALNIGDNFGTGTLDILNGGQVNNSDANIGKNSGTTSVVTVSGAGSTWDSSATLTVGEFGSGTLLILAGGVVNNVNASVGDNSLNSTGNVIVTGPGSTWASSGGLSIGSGLTSNVTIDNGGTVTNGLGTLGSFGGTTGAVDVTGVGSSWINTSDLTVGYLGDGNVTVTDGGVLDSAHGMIGSEVGSNGDVTVADPGSTWSADTVSVGEFGSGILNISNGGAVSNTDSYIGVESGSVGVATVTGTGSSWDNTSVMFIGLLGDGTLNIENGGAVTSDGGDIGSVPGASGVVTITGAGSSWINTSVQGIGLGDTGVLNVEDGGLFSADDAIFLAGDGTLNIDGGVVNANAGLDSSLGGTLNHTDGALNVTGGAFEPNAGGAYSIDGAGPGDLPHLTLGSGASAAFVGNLDIGFSTQAEVTLLDGAVVTNAAGIIGTIGSGTVNVTGAGTAWTNSNQLSVGFANNGVLNVSDGAAVSNTSGVIGELGGSTGVATVSGAGAAWMNSGPLVVGGLSSGTLNVQAGGTVTSDSGSIGVNTTLGLATVTGAGSTWANANGLTVGGSFGGGELNVFNGGSVSNVDGAIGKNTGGTSSVTVSGAGSVWDNSGDLAVGDFGDATLLIDSGAAVNSATGYIAKNNASDADVTVTGSGSIWTNLGGVFVGGDALSADGNGTLNVINDGSLNVGGELKIWDTSTVTLDGGSIVTNTLDNSTGGSFNFLAGSLTINNGVSIGPGSVFSSDLTLDYGKTLATGATTTISAGRTLTIDGGTLRTGSISGGGQLIFNTGTLGFTDPFGTAINAAWPLGALPTVSAGQTIEVAGNLGIDFASLLTVDSGGTVEATSIINSGELFMNGRTAAVNVILDLFNAGLIRGEGRISGPVSNGGTIEAINQSGELIFIDAVTNHPGGLIAIRDSAIRFNAGFTNFTQVSLGSGTSDIHGDVTNLGTLGLSSDAVGSVIGNLIQNGTANLLPGSRLVVYENFSGLGGTTGLGTLEVLGTLSPGSSPGAVTFGGDLVVGGGSSTLIELGGLLEGIEYDSISVLGNTILGGTLDVVLINAFTPTAGDSFDLFDFGSITGNFSAVNLPTLGGDLDWDTSNLLLDGTLSVISNLLDGDLNADGFVGIADLNIVLGVWNTNVTPGDLLAGDPSGDGFVGIADLNVVLGNWNAGTPPATEANAVVPEPSTLLLLAGGGAGLLRRRR